MKKIIISIATISVFIFTSCFTDSDTATVKINLGNIPLAKVEKKSIIDRFVALFLKEAIAQAHPYDLGVTIVHLGAFDANNRLLASQRISSNNYPENNTVEFDVPAGIRRKIVVLGAVQHGGEGEPGSEKLIDYYGVSDETDLIAGEVVPVEVEVKMLDYDYMDLEEGSASNNKPAKWRPIAGALKYDIYFNNSGVYSFHTNVTKNEYLHLTEGSFSLRIDFDFAKMKSDFFNFEITSF